jgi:cytochrome P450
MPRWSPSRTPALHTKDTQYVRRWATEDVTLAGEQLRPGCPVQVGLAAINRDRSVFPHPEVLNWHRPRVPAHAAFGFGSHACPGAPLARLELRHALEALLQLPGLQVVAERAHWNSNLNQHRLRQVRLRLPQLRKEDTHVG